MNNKKIGIILASIFAIIAIVFSYLVWGNYGYKYNEIYVKSDVNSLYLGKYKVHNYKEENNESSFTLSGLYKNEDIITKFSGFDAYYYKDDVAILSYNNSLYKVEKNENDYKISELINSELIGEEGYIIDFEATSNFINSYDDLKKLVDKTLDSSLFLIKENSIYLKSCFIKDDTKTWSENYSYSVSFENLKIEGKKL